MLRTEVDKLQTEKQHMSQLQEQVLDRIRHDIEVKNSNQDDNLINTKLQQSVEELNVRTGFFRDDTLLISLMDLDDHERLCQTNRVNQWNTCSPG